LDEGEGLFVGVVARNVGEERLVDAAEFFAVEVAEVDGSGCSGALVR
jgi:hypothetical protein